MLRAGFDAAALEKARSMLTSFRQFIEDNKDEIEALKVLVQPAVPGGAALRPGEGTGGEAESAAVLRRPEHPESLNGSGRRIEMVEPDKVRGKGGKQLVDVIALVRHAIDPNTPLAPVGMTVEERYQQWLAEQAGGGRRRSRPSSGSGSTPSRTTSPAA